MSKLERVTVAMPEEMLAKMQACVDAGEYATTSEIVREALRDWCDYQDRQQAKLEWLRAEIQKGIDSPSRPAKEVFDELLSELREMVEVEKKSAA